MHEIKVARPGDISLAVTVGGDGPLVVLVHGFPESWYSWRHQIGPLVDAGYRVAALHVRGYGNSSKPREVEAYSLVELAGDIAAVIQAIDPAGAILVGHDWGAVQVQTAALLYPELVRAIATLSVPAIGHTAEPYSSAWPYLYAGRLFYQTYFQTPGVAEAEFEGDLERFIRVFFMGMSGEGDPFDSPLIRPGDAKTPLDGLADPATLPGWFSPDDIAHYVASFRAGGLTGPLNRYRCTDLDWEQLAPYADRKIEQPALFIGGTRDPSRHMIPSFDLYADPMSRMTDGRGVHFLEGIGHWIQQEAPDETNRLLLSFLKDVTHISQNRGIPASVPQG